MSRIQVVDHGGVFFNFNSNSSTGGALLLFSPGQVHPYV